MFDGLKHVLSTFILMAWVSGFAQAGGDASLLECAVRDTLAIMMPKARSVTPPLINVFEAPDKDMRGLAYDGQFLWAANSGDDSSMYGPRIYKLDPDSGNVINSYAGVADYPCGLAWDGQYLWHSAFLAGMIYRFEVATMGINKSFTAPTSHPFDLAWDGVYLYAVRGNEPMISVIDTSTGLEIDSIEATYSSPNVRPFGLTCVSRSAPQLWTSDGNYGSNSVNLWDFFTNDWFDQWTAEPVSYPAGLAYDSVGERLWVSCFYRDSIYVYDVSQVGITADGTEYVSGFWIEVCPNPFTNFTDIRYRIPDNRQECELEIYDITGCLVTDLSTQISVSGYQSSVRWDGRDDSGGMQPAGVYFLDISGQRSAVKLVKLK